MKVKSAFAAAREQAPSILFIDEIDTLTRKRGTDHREYDAILNEVLVQMDGFDGREGVIVIGATNRVDTMDPAILRPGRFDRIVNVSLPDVEGRARILQVHTQDLPLSDEVDLDAISRRTIGYSGAQLENLANEAALAAARGHRELISNEDFEAALDKLMLGARRESLILTEDEKQTVIVHEAGHAFCAALLPESDPIERVTILPHGQALGAVVRAPEKDRVFASLARLKADIIVAMAGRAAEHIVFGPDRVTNGAAADIQHASTIAMHMICNWGMSENFGIVAVPPDPKDREVQREIARINKEAFDQAVTMIQTRRSAFDRLVRTLEERETLGRGDVERIIKVSEVQYDVPLMAAE
jgi:cell division protease FtsH